MNIYGSGQPLFVCTLAETTRTCRCGRFDCSVIIRNDGYLLEVALAEARGLQALNHGRGGNIPSLLNTHPG